MKENDRDRTMGEKKEFFGMKYPFEECARPVLFKMERCLGCSVREFCEAKEKVGINMDDSYIIVHCSNCGYEGVPKAIYVSDILHPDDTVPEMGCPNCSSDQWIDAATRTTKEAELNKLAIQVLSKHKLPTLFSYRQAFILGYRER